MTVVQSGPETDRADAPRRKVSYVRGLFQVPMAGWLVPIAGVLVLVLVVLPAVVQESPSTLNVDEALAAPSWNHPFGTDQLGRDVLSRVVHGARLSLGAAAASTLIALVVAVILGGLAATSRPWLQESIMRLVDVGLAFPGILLPLVLAAVMGPSVLTTVISLGVLFSFPMARVVRGAIFAEYGYDYVLAAKLLGTRGPRLVGYHIGLNAALPVLVYTTLIFAGAILTEAALSFLGAGVPPPAPSWGNIIRDGFGIVHAGAWWVSLFPGLAIVVTVLGVNRFSEALGRRLRLR